MNESHVVGFAEWLTTPGYVRAKNATWEANPEDLDDFHAVQAAAEDIILSAFLDPQGPNISKSFDIRRRTALNSLRDPNFAATPLFEHLESLQGSGAATELTKDDLGMGEPGPVSTNSAIKSLNDQDDLAPTQFLNEALEIIRDRSVRYTNSIGPENYATALKFFADRQTESDAELDPTESKELIKKWVEGYGPMAQKDSPNFVELTNIYAAVRKLPRGFFPSVFSRMLVEQSLEALPTFHRQVNMALLSAASKLHRNEAPLERAILVDLSLRMIGQFERTAEFRTALHAIENLLPSTATHNALRTVFHNGYRLQEPLEIEGLLEVTLSLKNIVEHAINDASLTMEAKDLAKSCASNAIARYKAKADDPTVSAEDLFILRQQVDVIVKTFSAM